MTMTLTEKYREEFVEKVETIINRYTPFPNFAIKEICARDILNEAVPIITTALREELEKEIGKLNVFYEENDSEGEYPELDKGDVLAALSSVFGEKEK